MTDEVQTLPMTEQVPTRWTARTSNEKARARRLTRSGKAKISSMVHETYIGKKGIVNYEAWEIDEFEDWRSGQDGRE